MPKRATLSTRAISTSTATTDQLPKGSGLTTSELDSNFLELRDQSFGVVGDDSATIDIAAGGTLYIQGGENVTTATNSDGSITINSTGGGDSLGDLEVTSGYNGYAYDTFLVPSNIASDIEVHISGRGNGNVNFPNNAVNFGRTDANSYIQITATGNLIRTVGSQTLNPPVLTLRSGSDQSQDYSQIRLEGKYVSLNNNINSFLDCRGGNGDFYIRNGPDTNDPTTGTHNSIVLTDDNDGEIQINHKGGKWTEIGSRLKFFQNEITTLQSNDDLVLTGNGTGSVTINGLVMPTTDGTAGQALVTNGAGVLSFAAVDASINIDGGTAESTYGGITAIDGGDAT
jgi:hypothetical protein